MITNTCRFCPAEAGAFRAFLRTPGVSFPFCDSCKDAETPAILAYIEKTNVETAKRRDRYAREYRQSQLDFLSHATEEQLNMAVGVVQMMRNALAARTRESRFSDKAPVSLLGVLHVGIKVNGKDEQVPFEQPLDYKSLVGLAHKNGEPIVTYDNGGSLLPGGALWPTDGMSFSVCD